MYVYIYVYMCIAHRQKIAHKSKRTIKLIARVITVQSTFCSK